MSKNNKNKKIYIVLAYTGTALSKLIRVYTKAKYCHVSISLDKDLNEMYSFGRLNAYNPFIGGFVHEGKNIGTFKRFKKSIVKIYSIDVSEEQFNEIELIINNFKSKRKNYNFNIIGLFLAGFNVRYKRDNYFYCAEFVKYLIDSAGIDLSLPNVVKPIDFQKDLLMNLEYKGLLTEY